MRRQVLLSALSAALFTFPACESADRGTPTTVTDSAGVQITLSGSTGGIAATVGDTPIWSVGGPDASGPEQFAFIRSVLLTRSGTIWVADQGSKQLRLFDRDGHHLRSVGGAGSGPGEYQSVQLLGEIRGDTVVAVDDRTRRTYWYDRSGELVREISAMGTEIGRGRHKAVFASGDFAGFRSVEVFASELSPGTRLDDPISILRWNRENEIVGEIGTGPADQWLWTGQNSLAIPYTAPMEALSIGEELHVTSGPAYRIRVFAPDGQTRSYGLQGGSRILTDSLRKAHLDFIERLPESRRARYEEVLEAIGFPATAYAYDDLVSGSDGQVWARLLASDRGAAARWHVYRADGSFLGIVDTPHRFFVYAVLSDSIVGVWLDEFDVEHLREYPLAWQNRGS